MQLKIKVNRGKGKGPDGKAAAEAARAWGAKEAPAIVRATISKLAPFHDVTGMAHHAWGAKATATGIHVFSMVPYTKFLNDGWAGGQMTHLVGKTVPIGNGLFRRVTQASIDRGGWMRPARPATHFFEAAMEELQDALQDRFPGLQFSIT